MGLGVSMDIHSTYLHLRFRPCFYVESARPFQDPKGGALNPPLITDSKYPFCTYSWLKNHGSGAADTNGRWWLEASTRLSHTWSRASNTNECVWTTEFQQSRNIGRSLLIYGLLPFPTSVCAAFSRTFAESSLGPCSNPDRIEIVSSLYFLFIVNAFHKDTYICVYISTYIYIYIYI